jgi:hypothetical protein
LAGVAIFKIHGYHTSQNTGYIYADEL